MGRWRDTWILGREGLRLARRELTRSLTRRPPTRHTGSAEEICRAIVDEVWNGRYLQAGVDHLDQFWIRDLAITLEGLIDLGQSERVEQSLVWAFKAWRKAGRITTTVFPFGEAVDIFTYSCDSLPFLLYCLERLGLDELRREHRELLNREAELYQRILVDPHTGTLRHDRMFSSTKDTMHFTGTCAATCMLGWCHDLLARAEGLDNPLTGLATRAALDEWFWTGSFFRNDVDSLDLCSADANFWPWWCGLIDDDARLKSAVEAMVDRGLDHPFPLKYHALRMPERELELQRFFLPNYQGDAIWTFFTCQWIELVHRVDPERARGYIQSYDRMLEQHGTWIEVFDPSGDKPLKGRFGHGSDWAMIWAASFPRVRRLVLAETPTETALESAKPSEETA